jgi:hypothetical protein
MSAAHGSDSKAPFLAQRGALHPHPERVQDVLFGSGIFFDARDLIQVRYEMVRRHRIDGQSVPQVARSFGVSRQSLYPPQASRGGREQDRLEAVARRAR